MSSPGPSYTPKERERDEMRSQLNSSELRNCVLPSGQIAPCSKERAVVLLALARSLEPEWDTNGVALAESLDMLCELLSTSRNMERQIHFEADMLFHRANRLAGDRSKSVVLLQAVHYLEDAMRKNNSREFGLTHGHDRYHWLSIFLGRIGSKIWPGGHPVLDDAGNVKPSSRSEGEKSLGIVGRTPAEASIPSSSPESCPPTESPPDFEWERLDGLRKQLDGPELRRNLLSSGEFAPCSEARALVLLELARSLEPQYYENGASLAESLDRLCEMAVTVQDLDDRIGFEMDELVENAHIAMRRGTTDVHRQAIDYLECASVMTGNDDSCITHDDVERPWISKLLKYTRKVARLEEIDEVSIVMPGGRPEELMSQGGQASVDTHVELPSFSAPSISDKLGARPAAPELDSSAPKSDERRTENSERMRELEPGSFESNVAFKESLIKLLERGSPLPNLNGMDLSRGEATDCFDRLPKHHSSFMVHSIREILDSPELRRRTLPSGSVQCSDARAHALLALAVNLKSQWRENGATLAESLEALSEVVATSLNLDDETYLFAKLLFMRAEGELKYRCTSDRLRQAIDYLVRGLDLGSIKLVFTRKNKHARNFILLEGIRDFMILLRAHHGEICVASDITASSRPKALVSPCVEAPVERSTPASPPLSERRRGKQRQLDDDDCAGESLVPKNLIATSGGALPHLARPYEPQLENSASTSLPRNRPGGTVPLDYSQYDQIRSEAQQIRGRCLEQELFLKFGMSDQGVAFLTREIEAAARDELHRDRIRGFMSGFAHLSGLKFQTSSFELLDRITSDDVFTDLWDTIDLCAQREHEQYLRNRASNPDEMAEKLLALARDLVGFYHSQGQEDLSYLHSAIKHLQTVVALPLSDRLGWHAHRELGDCLFERYKETGVPSDLYSSIEALLSSVGDDAHLARVCEILAPALWSRFRLEDPECDIDVQVAVELARIVAHQNGDVALLGYMLLCRFKALGDSGDLDDAISYLRQAVDECNSSSAADELSQKACAKRRATAMKHLARCLLKRYSDLTRADEDALEAMTVFTSHVDALSLVEPPSVLLKVRSMCSILLHLSTQAMPRELQERCKVFLDTLGNPAEAAWHLAQDVSSSPQDRLGAATFISFYAYDREDFDEALKGYTTVMDLLPLAGWNGRAFESREASRETLRRLSSEGPLCAMQLGFYEKAIEMSEHVRSLFWWELSRFRVDFAELEKRSPKLAERLKGVRNQLQCNSTELYDSKILSGTAMQRMLDATAEVKARKRRKLLVQWEDSVAEARYLDGFEDFMKPVRYSTLQMGATCGPVIILICGPVDSDALIVELNKPIKHIKLEVSDGEAFLMANRLRECLLHGQDDSGVLRDILKRLWLAVCNPILQSLGTNGERKKHVWWCPTGAFTSLPIHAAGKYSSSDRPIGSHTVPSHVISSYTTNLGQLVRGIRQSEAPSNRPKLMFVGMEQAPPYAATALPLTSVHQEMDAIANTILPEDLTCLYDGADGASATVDNVLHQLRAGSHDLIHFACHGVQNPDVPLESGLLLHDKPLTLLRLLEWIGSFPAEEASFSGTVFLSACETAPGSAFLDQAVHLAAGMQHVGFNSVVATLWPIKDDFAPKVAKHFYTQILKEDGEYPCGRDAGRALHEALQAARNLPDCSDLWNWVPYIHVGV